MLRFIGGYLYLLAGWLSFALILMVGTVVCIGSTAVRPVQSVKRDGRLLVQGAFRFYVWFLHSIRLIRVDLSELDNLPERGPGVIVANHPSLLDAVMILSKLPNGVCLMKAALSSNFLLGYGARMAGYINNDSPRSVVAMSARELKQGAQLVLFPEGTRTVNHPLNELNASFALIAWRAQVPVQVFTIESSSGFLGKNWPLTKLPVFPVRYRIRRIGQVAPTGGRQAIFDQTQKMLRDAILTQNESTPARQAPTACAASNQRLQ